MAFLGQTKIGLKKTGVSASVPENPKAKLMYYLRCVCAALETDDGDNPTLRRLKNYSNYSSLTREEVDTLITLCYIFSPDVLTNKVFFQDDEMCGDSSNEFYELSAVSNRFLVSRTLLIGGQTRTVKKIMTFKMSWIRENWADPMQELLGSRRAVEQQRARRQNSDCTIL